MANKFVVEMNEGPDFNILAIEDYLRRINDEQTRKEIILQYGGTQEEIREFEKLNDIPSGAFELAVMMEDPRVREMNRQLVDRYSNLINAEDQRRIAEYQQELSSFYSGLNQLYPDALRFLTQYQLLSARMSGARSAALNESELYECQFVWPIVAVAAAVVVLAVALANLVVAANAAAAANAVALANVNVTGD